jgi:hypothetical protein
MMEVLDNLPRNKGLDFVLHSPGRSAEAAESIVKYMRSMFTDVRVLIPHAGARCTRRRRESRSTAAI